MSSTRTRAFAQFILQTPHSPQIFVKTFEANIHIRSETSGMPYHMIGIDKLRIETEIRGRWRSKAIFNICFQIINIVLSSPRWQLKYLIFALSIWLLYLQHVYVHNWPWIIFAVHTRSCIVTFRFSVTTFFLDYNMFT